MNLEGLPLFDNAASHSAKNSGMELAAENAQDHLSRAREIAASIALRGNGTCNADQVLMEFPSVSPGPWCGSIFRGKEWVFTGERIHSSRVSNHAREIKVWRYEP